MLSPTALGGPADYFGRDNYWETLLSIGLVPLLLATVAVFMHPDRKLVRGWLVLVGLAVWFACGRALLLYTAAYYMVPGMSWFRVPARTLFLANLGGAVLAGLGVQALATRLADRRDWRRFAAWSGGLMLSIILSLYVIASLPHPQSFSRTIEGARRVLADDCFRSTLGGLAALLALGCAARSPRTRRLGGGLDWPSGPVRAGLARELAIAGRSGREVCQWRPCKRRTCAARPDSDRAVRGRIKARDNFYSDLSAVCHGFEKANVNDAFQIDHAARLYELLYPVASRRR